MVSTVTTSTVTIITATTLAFGLGLTAVLGLLIMLATRELASASHSPRFRQAGRYLAVGIAPLLFAFAVIVAARFASLLS